VTTAADPHLYPAPRKERGASAALQDLGGIQAPRMRVFPFYWSFAANSRRSWSTPQLQGPCIIRDIQLNWGAQADPPTTTLEIGTSSIPILENDVALTTPRSYNVLTELQDPDALVSGAAGAGLVASTLSTAGTRPITPLDLIVLDPSTYIVLASINDGIAAAALAGTLRVLEGVDPEALATFL